MWRNHDRELVSVRRGDGRAATWARERGLLVGEQAAVRADAVEPAHRVAAFVRCGHDTSVRSVR